MSYNKYINHNSNTISRDESSTDREGKLPNWLGNFAKNLEIKSVQSREYEPVSTYDQISQILGNKSKFSNVEEIVNDMKRRTGLEEFLKIKAEEKVKLKSTAAEDNFPKIFKDLPKIKIFVDNYIGDRPGTAIEAVVHSIENNFKSDLRQEDLDDNLRSYINSKILEVKKLHPKSDQNDLDLGKLDLDDSAESELNSDVFQGCLPAKIAHEIPAIILSNKYFKIGYFCGKEDKEKNQASDILSAVSALKDKIPLEMYKLFALGYCAAAQFDLKEEKFELDRINKFIERHKK